MIKKILLPALLLSAFGPAAYAAADKEAYLHFMNGMVQERKGNYDSAMQEYKRTLLLDPQSVFVYKQALNLALHIGKVDEAAEWADFVVKADSATADNWVLYGNVRWAKGDLDGAAAAYEKATGLDPADHEAFYQLASLWSSRNPEKAIGYLQKYLELRPEDAAEVYYQIAVLYNAKGDLDNVKQNLLSSKEADPDYSQPRYMLAGYYEAKNDTAAAISEYQELTDLEPGNTELFDHLGELYAGPAANNLPEAEKYFLKAWAKDKTDPTACFWLSVINEQRHDFTASAAFLETSSALKEDAAVTLRLAYYYTQSGHYDRAIMLLEAAVKKWPENGEVAYFLALGYDDTGHSKKATEMLKGLLTKNPDNADARMQYAVISERENDMPEAEASFRYLISKKPDNATVLNYLGYALADRGLKLDEAEVMISSAVALDPGNGAYLDSLAWVNFKLGRQKEAMDVIKKSIKAIYDDPAVWAHAGDIYEAAGDHRTAWLAWKNSRLLEKPAHRATADARLKTLQKEIPAAEAGALETAYLKNFSPFGQPFSSFAKAEAKLRGKTIKFDAILQFSPPEDFSITVMGPLMAPLWKAKLSGGSMEMDTVSIKDLDPEAFSYWASLMTGELSEVFSGATLTGLQQRGGWDSDCLNGPGREVCLDDSQSWPAEITTQKEPKLTLKPGAYFFKDLYLFPGTLEFKLPFVSLKLTLDREQMNFSGVNTLKLPE